MSPPQFAYIARVVIYLGLKKILSRRRVPHGTPSPVPSHGRTSRRRCRDGIGADINPIRNMPLSGRCGLRCGQNSEYQTDMTNGLAPSPNHANRRNSRGSSRSNAHRDRDRLPSRNRGAFRDALGVHPRVSADGYIPVYRTGRADNGTTRDKSYGSCRMRPRKQARTEVAPKGAFPFSGGLHA